MPVSWIRLPTTCSLVTVFEPTRMAWEEPPLRYAVMTWCTSASLNSRPKVSSETASSAPPLANLSFMLAADYFLLDVPVLTLAGAIFLRFLRRAAFVDGRTMT